MEFRRRFLVKISKSRWSKRTSVSGTEEVELMRLNSSGWPRGRRQKRLRRSTHLAGTSADESEEVKGFEDQA